MPERAPVEVTNLDRYGNPEIPWSRPRDLLAASLATPDTAWFLGTVRPDGRPHAAGIGALWFDGDIYIVSGPGTRKARNLAANPACTIAMHLPDGLDLVLDGEAAPIDDPAILEPVGALIRHSGWPVERTTGGFTAPFGPWGGEQPPWRLYRFVFHTAIGQGADGATRWRFAR